MLAAAFVTILLLILLINITHRKKRLPGPWNLPIIGYLHKLDSAAPYLTLTKLAQQYGPVYGVKLGLMNVAVIADPTILKQILSKDETTERPPLYMINTAFGGKGSFQKFCFRNFTLIVGLVCASVWKDQRKFVSNFFKASGVSRVSPNRKIVEELIKKHVDEFIQVIKSSILQFFKFSNF
ncbi:hypothetical protein Zmor_022908 [Zophobas morio]|uniref:Uncharacterized protein n=1 Tax=Zophobas morio TaxID=2755281 RepID=A0AA38M6K8_9CUCU|nr:hypothetical protein Zmor_022908 [Zophobas morio]